MRTALDVDRYLAMRFHRESYNCWDLLREAYLEATGLDVGDRTPHPATAFDIKSRFEEQESDFIRIPTPETPSIVLMRRGLTVPHVGLYWYRRVLHMRPSGPRYERLVDAARGFSRVSFHQCRTS